MKNGKGQKGYQLTEKGAQYTNKQRQNKGANRQGGNKSQNKNEQRVPGEQFHDPQPSQNKGNKPAFSSRPDWEGNPDSFPSSAGNTHQEAQAQPAGVVESDLAREIKEDIRRDASLTAVKEDINVSIENGVATLTGKVATEEQKITAGNKAIAHMGSDKVNNDINVIYMNEG